MIEGWTSFFKREQRQPYYQALMAFLAEEDLTKVIYPRSEDWFQCFTLTPYEEVKVVILGQDPYHEENQAHGLAFSVNHGIAVPPSLRNIFKELEQDVDLPRPLHGNLSGWAKQGVLLLNTVLTVEKGKANSHKGKGWETFTDHVLSYLNQRERPIVYILWGNQARKKAELLTNQNHLILSSSHPSPLSAYHTFFGSKPFSQTNDFLLHHGMSPIQWQLQEEFHVSPHR